MNAVITQDGQIEIPRELREQLGLEPGTVLELQNQAGTLVAWKKVETDVFEKWRGRGTLPAGGRERSYRLWRPVSVETGKRAPLVVVLHGGFGSAGQAEQSYGWDELADRHGFLVAYPDGVGRSWNAGWCCGAARTQEVDDVAFVRELVAEVSATDGVDPRRVFAAGVSNGGMLAYRVACESPGLLAAIGVVAGTMVCDCLQPGPVSLLHIHGLEDRSVPFWGGAGLEAGNRRGHCNYGVGSLAQ